MGRRIKTETSLQQIPELIAAALKVIEAGAETLPKDCITLTVRQAAKSLHVDEDAVRGWIRSGDLEAMHLGPRQTRIPGTAMAKFIRQRTTRLSDYTHQEAA